MNGIDSLVSTKSLIVYQYLKYSSQARITFIKTGAVRPKVPRVLEYIANVELYDTNKREIRYV